MSMPVKPERTTDSESKRHLFRLVAAAVILFIAMGSALLWPPVLDFLTRGYHFLSDREQVNAFIAGFGPLAPLIFMGFQILQVIFAPIPGEATGFVGGYLFGTLLGFCYSSIALSIGSWINFFIGRLLGERYIRKWIPPDKLTRFDSLVKRQGIIVVAILFLFPGFPKDYLCLFLGLTAIPTKIFIIIASVGRMPGTLMLSMQGSLLNKKMYLPLAVVMGLSLVLIYVAYRKRDAIYDIVKKMNRH